MIYCAYKRRRTMKLINKIIRKVTASELAQATVGGIIEGETDAHFAALIRQAGSDGCVLLKNNDGVLPFNKNDNVAVFGRVQNDWFYVGNGSGGDVCVPYRTSLIEGIEKNSSFKINQGLKIIYRKWSAGKKNIVDPGFWAHWPRFYPEMPLSRETVKRSAQLSNKALVVIGRSAGEDRENVLEKGSFFLTKQEKNMLDKVTAEFDKVVLLLNIGSVIDCSEIEGYGDKISSVMIVWQGGMESGNSVADVLSGKVSPSGRLTDTVAKKYEDYPSSDNFGSKGKNYYKEDIFVGYRYFETFAPEKVLYEFGFGLSYTDFETKKLSAKREGRNVSITLSVTNTGSVSGKEVVQLYAECPQGVLGKPARVLVDFKKTSLLEPGQSEKIEFCVPQYSYASYDDSGVTGNLNCYVLEKGKYSFYCGTSVRKCEKVLSYTLADDTVIERLSEQLAIKPEDEFERIHASATGYGAPLMKNEGVPVRRVNLKDRISSALPEGKKITGDKGIKLSDVKKGKATLDSFVAQLSLNELESITRGEGMMNSAHGAKGNAGIFAGVSDSLREKGIPPITTTDGPSGIRLLSSCSLLPCGTALACTWDTELVGELFTEMGKEMVSRGSDVLLAPGMNIHRSHLCGRNFEYYSEDPLITGKIAAATVNGIQSQGVSACPKHFACNNQEYSRIYTDSIVSQRALREIYLKGFEICVKEAAPKCIMTSYNKINGVWSHYNYELCTEILRKEWGYGGMVMTDWWMRYAPSPEFPNVNGNAYRVRAQVDVLMPGARTAVSKTAENDGTLLSSYGEEGGITLGEIQRSAKNVLNFALNSNRI